MKAIVHTRFGRPSDVLELQEIERPAIGHGGVLVRVHAAAVARGDWLIANGLPYIARPAYGIRTPKHPVAGLELSGTVEAVGPGVSRFAPGDEVFGWGDGALAEFVASAPERLAHKPASVTFEQAAAVPVSALAALQALRLGEVQPGDDVLVIGASGGVGSYAVQIARAMGARVTGVAGTRNLDLVAELGASDVIDYTAEEITDRGRRFDVIIDIAGNRRISTLRAALHRRGTLVIVGGTGGRGTMGFGRTIRATLLNPFVSQRLRGLISKPNAEDLAVLGDLIGRREVTPRVDRTYPLREAARAIELVGDGKSRAKTVVTV